MRWAVTGLEWPAGMWVHVWWSFQCSGADARLHGARCGVCMHPGAGGRRLPLPTSTSASDVVVASASPRSTTEASVGPAKQFSEGMGAANVWHQAAGRHRHCSDARGMGMQWCRTNTHLTAQLSLGAACVAAWRSQDPNGLPLPAGAKRLLPPLRRLGACRIDLCTV